MSSKIFVLDANLEDRLNEKFTECSKFRNLEAAFKPVELEKLLNANSRVLKALENFKLCVAVSCSIFDVYKKRKFLKGFLSVLSHENCEVLSSTYYHSVFFDYEEFELQVFSNLEKLEDMGFEVKGFFSTCVLPYECLSVLSKFEYAIVNADMPAICRKGVVVIPKCCEVECVVTNYSNYSKFEPEGKSDFLFPSEVVKAIKSLRPCEDVVRAEIEESEAKFEAKRALKRCKSYGYFRFYPHIWRRLQNTEIFGKLENFFSSFMNVTSCYQLRCSRRMKSRVAALAMRTLPVEKAFYFSNGVAYDVEEFYELLKKCDENDVKGFIERNDFSKWIGDVLYDKFLASVVSKCKSKEEVLKVLRSRIDFYRKRLS